MADHISGTVTYNKTPNICTIKVPNFFGKKNIDIEIFDRNNTAGLGDFIVARKIILPQKGKDWRLIQIIRRGT